ncbi:MAG: PAS domain S-box protein [Nitrospira sp.]|nr:PAS domain S-box protein [Nitrospira sp.]
MANRYRWFPIYVVAMTAAVGGLLLYGVSKLENYLMDRTGRDLQWAAMEIAEKLDLLLFERYGDTQLIQAFSLHASNTVQTSQWKQHFVHLQNAYPIYAWIGLLDKAGRVVVATDSDTVGKEIGPNRQGVSSTSESGIMLAEYQHDVLVQGQPTVGFSFPITLSQSPLGLPHVEGTIATRIALSELDELVTRSIRTMKLKMQARGGMEYQVINKYGQVIIESLQHTGEPANLLELGVTSAKSAVSGQSGFVMEDHARRPVKVLTGYAPIPERKEFASLRWGVLVRVDHKAALAPIHDVVQTVTIWGAAILLPLWGGLIWMMSRLRSEWRQTEIAQHASQEMQDLLQAILDNALDAHLLVDQTGRIASWNSKAEMVFGWSAREVVGQSLGHLRGNHGEPRSEGTSLEECLEIRRGLASKGRTEVEVWHKDGRAFPIELTVIGIKRPSGYWVSAFIRDITAQKIEERYQSAERRIAEVLLEASSVKKASREMIRTICEMLEWRVGIFWMRDKVSNTIRYAEGWHAGSDKCARFHEESKHAVFGVGEGLPGRACQSGKVEWVADVVADRAFIRAGIAEQAGLHGACGVPVKVEGSVQAIIELIADGVRPIDGRAMTFLNNLGTQFSQYCSRQIMQGKLKTSEARFSGIIQMADDAIINIDEAQRIVIFNRGAESIFGYAASEAIGRSLDMLIPIALRGRHQRYLQEFAGKSTLAQPMGRRGEIVGLRKNGEEFPAEASVAKVSVDGKSTYAVILRDITKRKQEEEALKTAKRKAEELVAQNQALLTTVEAFFVQLTDAKVVSEWTKQAEAILEIPRADAIGRTFRDLGITWDWEIVSAAFDHVVQGKESFVINKISLDRPELPPRYLKLTISPLVTYTGVDIVLMGEDITEYLSLERDLAQAQKLESLGQLAAGVAHEINTPTQFVGDNLRFMSESLIDVFSVLDCQHEVLRSIKSGCADQDAIVRCEEKAQRVDLEYLVAELPKAIAQSQEGVERIAKIVRAMKEFAHPGGDEKVFVDLNKAIETTIEVSRNEWKYVANLAIDLEPHLPPVLCQVGPINQAVLNIIVNAAHAIQDVVKGTAEKGWITVTSRSVGAWVEICIADTGAGISESIRQKIFDPFFTTKPVGKGTGQGLAIARSVVVEKHGGTITVESEVGRGTTFIIRLPFNLAGEQASRPRAA